MYDNKELGHLERPVAAAIAPLHNLQLLGFRIVGYVQYCQTICMFGRPYTMYFVSFVHSASVAMLVILNNAC